MKPRIAAWGAAAVLGLTLVAAPAQAGTSGRWLHIRVDERDDDTKVRVNLPLTMLENIAPVLDEMGIDLGKVDVGDKDLDAAQLRKLWNAVRTADEGEYVTVESVGENVRVAKAGSNLLIKATDETGGAGTVDIRMPISVIDALLSGPGDTLNFVAAVKALGASGPGELVSVNDSDATVRIWIDSENGGRSDVRP